MACATQAIHRSRRWLAAPALPPGLTSPFTSIALSPAASVSPCLCPSTPLPSTHLRTEAYTLLSRLGSQELGWAGPGTEPTWNMMLIPPENSLKL